MGGLTVLAELIRRLPNERFIYLGDTARVPYGSRSPETIRRYSMEMASYLVKRDIKYLVIACNTSTAHAEALLTEKVPVPLLGVVKPGVAALIDRAGDAPVGVLGTRATVKSGVYEAEIHRRRPGLQVLSRACPLFVPLVEEGWTDRRVTEEVIREYVDDLVKAGVRRLVLGCTHYPMLKGAFRRVYPELDLVDSSVEMARTVEAELQRLGLRADSARDAGDTPGPDGTQTTRVRILLTDVTEHNASLTRLLLGLDLPVEEVLLDEPTD